MAIISIPFASVSSSDHLFAREQALVYRTLSTVSEWSLCAWWEWNVGSGVNPESPDRFMEV